MNDSEIIVPKASTIFSDYSRTIRRKYINIYQQWETETYPHHFRWQQYAPHEMKSIVGRKWRYV